MQHNLSSFITRLSNEDIEAEFEVVPLSSCPEEFESAFSQDIQERLDIAHGQLEKYDKKIDRLTNQADKVDYIIAASCGLLTGLIDAFFIGDAEHGRELGSKPVNSFVEHFARKNGYAGNGGLAGSINFLESKFKSPTDNIWSGKGLRISTYSHHLDDYAHHPTLVGMMCSVLTQFTKVGYFQNREGSLFKIEITDEGLIGKTFWGKIGAGIINWFGHLVSDMAGASSTAGAGMGIPGPIISLAKEFAALPGLKDSNLPSTLSHMFKDHNADLCFDLRCEVGQSIPVLANICIVTVFYMIRRMIFAIRAYKAGEKVNLVDLIPSANRTYARMMTIASGVFVATDMADAGIRSALTSGANPALAFAKFVSRVNIVGVGHFAIALGKDVSMGIKRETVRNQRICLYNEIISLTEAKVSCSEYGMWKEAKQSVMAIEQVDEMAQKAYLMVAKNWKDITVGLSALSQKREAIEKRNPGFLGDLAAEFERVNSINMSDANEILISEVHLDFQTSPEQLHETIRKQVQTMERLDKKIQEASGKVSAARQKADDAHHKISVFQKKQSIEELQVAVLALSEAIAAEDDAMQISFCNQQMMANVAHGLLTMGLMNLATNRTVFQSIKEELQKASEEEINEHARQELMKIVGQLKAQEDIYNRLDRQAGINEAMQSKMLQIEATHEELVGAIEKLARVIETPTMESQPVPADPYYVIAKNEKPQVKSTSNHFALAALLLSLATIVLSVLHVLGCI